MTTITLRISEEEKFLFQMLANFEGLSLSESIRKTMLERAENEYDLNALNTTYQKFITSGEKARDISELAKEVGFEW